MSQINRFWRRLSGSGAGSGQPPTDGPADRQVLPALLNPIPDGCPVSLSDAPRPRDYQSHLAHVLPPIRWYGNLADIHLA